MTAPSIWDRISTGAGRLFGVPQGLLEGEAQRYAERQGLLGFGTSLLGASGYTNDVPLSTNQIIAQGIQAGRGGAQQGVETGLALQERERQMALEQARQQIAMKYQGRWNDPQAIRQMAGELMNLGDQEGAKAALDLVKSMPQRQITDLAGPNGQNMAVSVNPENPSDQLPVGQRYEEPALVSNLQGPGNKPYTGLILKSSGKPLAFLPQFEPGQPPPTELQLFQAATTAAAEFRSQVGEVADKARRLRSVLTVSGTPALEASEAAERGEKVTGSRGADQVALLQGFLDVVNRASGSMRQANTVVQSGKTLYDIVDEKVKFFSREGKASVLPSSMMRDIIRIMDEGIAEMEQNVQSDRQRFSNAFKTVPGMDKYEGFLMSAPGADLNDIIPVLRPEDLKAIR